MRGIQRFRNLARKLEDAIGGQRAGFHEVADRAALEQFHRDERLPVMLAELVDRTNVRVLERGREPCFAFETCEPLGRSHRLRPEQLDGELASEAQILRAIHYAHTPFAEVVEQPVV
jgi:hypothetical protein